LRKIVNIGFRFLQVIEDFFPRHGVHSSLRCRSQQSDDEGHEIVIFNIIAKANGMIWTVGVKTRRLQKFGFKLQR